MTDKEIVEEFYSIPVEDRKRLLREIKEDKKKHKRDIICDHVKVMYDLTGVDALYRCSDRKHCDSRAVIAYVLKEKGFSEWELSAGLKKDHSMIHKYIDDIRFYLKKGVVNSTTELLNEYKLKLMNYDIH